MLAVQNTQNHSLDVGGGGVPGGRPPGAEQAHADGACVDHLGDYSKLR